MTVHSPHMLHIGPLRLDPMTMRLQAAGGVVHLRPKATALLILLASRPGETFGKDELLDSLWPDRDVDEKNLVMLVAEIRKALAPFLNGDSAVATIPGKGYRLAVDVREAQERRQSRASSSADSGARERIGLLILPLRVPAEDSLADLMESLAASLTTRLAGIANVLVPDRGASWPAAMETQADFVLSGTAASDGQRIRVNLHLVDALRRIVLWGDQVTTTREGLFDIEDRFCERVAGKLAALSDTGIPSESHASVEPHVIHAYRLGCHFLSRRTASSLARAREFFGLALKDDGHFAPAMVGLAQCWAVEAYYTDADPRVCAERAVDYSARALAIDPRSSRALAASGFANLNLLEWNRAEDSLLRALALDPRDVDAHHWYSEFLVCSGRHDEAIRTMQTALQIDPTSSILNSDLGKLLMLARRFDEAATQFRTTIDLDPAFALAYYRLALTLACQGKFSEALQTCAHAVEFSPEVPLYSALRAYCDAVSGRRNKAAEVLGRLRMRHFTRPSAAYGIGLLHLGLGEKDVALDTLRHAVRRRAPMMIYAQVDPLLDGLRGTPGFQELSRDLSLPV